jgi:hypothetical protein
VSYQRNPLAAQLIAAHQAHAAALEENQRLSDLLTEARQAIRELRTDKIRLQARNANLKKYRPQAPPELTAPRDEAEQRRMEADAEIATWHRKRRAA